MKVGKTQKRIMAMIASEYIDVINDGKVSRKNQCRIAYQFVPFFLKQYKGMPKPQRIDLDGISVESADSEWIADNINLKEIIDIFSDGCDKNKVSEEEKKS